MFAIMTHFIQIHSNWYTVTLRSIMFFFYHIEKVVLLHAPVLLLLLSSVQPNSCASCASECSNVPFKFCVIKLLFNVCSNSYAIQSYCC